MAAEPTIARLVTVCRRHTPAFLVCCVVGLLLGFLYTVFATPLYTASATILIGHRQPHVLRDSSSPSDGSTLDPAIVESQAEIMHSEQVGLLVVRKLKLADRPENKSWASALKSLIPFSSPTPREGADAALRKELLALKRLNGNLHVSRVPKTFLIQLDYTDASPQIAAEIVNAYTEAYLQEQETARIGIMKRAREALESRAEELRALSAQADLAVQKFKADNNLLATRGVFLSEQQFSDMNAQLVTQQAAAAQARARWLNLKEIIESHRTGSDVIESLSNPVINDLRTKYITASRRATELELRVGPEHRTVKELKRSMVGLQNLIFQELGRIAATYKSDYEVAVAREKALSDNLDRQQGVVVSAGNAQVHLRQLEQKAESYKLLYQNYMQRYQEAEQAANLPVNESTIVSAAIPPLAPSYPRTSLALALSLVLGGLVGVGVGLVQELLDRGFRTRAEVQEELGVSALGILPQLAAMGEAPSLGQLAPIYRYAIDHPRSEFSESLRFVKASVDQRLKNHQTKTIGVISLLPNEGKTTVAKNFASLLAAQGSNTILIDADSTVKGLSQAIRSGAESMQRSPLGDLCPSLASDLRQERDTHLNILLNMQTSASASIEDFSFRRLETLLKDAGKSIDYVVVDFPPIGPVSSARSVVHAIDAFLLVIAWSATSRAAVRTALSREPTIQEKLLGVILNKVDREVMKKYLDGECDDSYHADYEKYIMTTKRA
jgi:polysaccharide biosynthesis transport protein